MVLTKVFNILLLCKLKIRFLDAQNQHGIRKHVQGRSCSVQLLFCSFKPGRVVSDYILMKTISLLTSTLVLSQISAKEDLELVAVSSSSFKGPLKLSSLFMLPEWFASIALGKSLRRADLCATTENKLSQLEFLFFKNTESSELPGV